MKAIEIFKSHQGEGRYTGTLMTFVRFKVCKRPFSDDLCPMCDTMSKMNNCLEMEFKPKDLTRYLKDTSYNICFTGGEPTLYLKDIEEIIGHFYDDIMKNEHACMHFETNGYNFQDLDTLLFNKFDLPKSKYFIAYSPKFFNVDELSQALDFLKSQKHSFNNSSRDVIKLVVGENSYDLVEIYLKKMPKELYPNVYLMPEGFWPSYIQKSMKYVGRLVKQYNVNISDRLHIIHSFM